MKKIKTSAVMRAIVADKTASGAQRDGASRVVDYMGSRPRAATFNDLYDRYPFSLRRAAAVPYREEVVYEEARKRVHDAIVKLAEYYGIQPTEET